MSTFPTQTSVSSPAVLLEVTHETDLSYSDVISESVMELRVCPLQAPEQYRLSFDLAIGPQAVVNSYFDWLDNLVHAFTISAPHDRIRIIAKSIVELDRPAPVPQALPDTWPCTEAQDDYTLYDWLAFDGRSIALQALADEVAPQADEPLGNVTERMLDAIKSHFIYTTGVTTYASPIDEVLEHRKGVCQDFSHLMIGMCRCLGIPARYVSGLVHTDRSARGAQYLGASQTHAWCEVYFPSFGWVGLDPTNHCPVGNDFVRVAVGRHFADVPPNKGLYRGKAKEKIGVKVTTKQLKSVPPELLAEHVHNLPMPTAQILRRARDDDGGQQQQQQQQQ